VRLLKASKKQPCPGKETWWMIAKETEEQKKEAAKGNEIFGFCNVKEKAKKASGAGPGYLEEDVKQAKGPHCRQYFCAACFFFP